MGPRLLTAAITLAAAITAVPAHAAGGITPLSPKSGATVPAGKPTTFKLRSSRSGEYWVRICKSAKKDSSGLICSTAQMGHATKGSGGVYTFKTPFYGTPTFWLNVPGTYYWQAQRGLTGGPVVKFKVG
jgi:hypothetical protein